MSEPPRVRPGPEPYVRLRRVEFEILVTLGRGPSHGYAVLKAIEARDGPSVGMTTLYRTLQRLRDRGLIEPADDPSGEDRRDVWALTGPGRRATAREAERLRALLAEVGRGVLGGRGPA